MIDVFPFAGYPVAVMGLGRSGLSAARALKQSGAEVWAWDDNEDRRAVAREAGVPLIDLHAADLAELTTLVLSPGIPHTHPAPHPVAARAKAAGCEIICDIELLARSQRDCAYIGVTGTNGKSTTTALIGHMLEMAGREVEVGGNFGIPVLELEALGPDGAYVLEMSSYQLELTFSITFDVAVLLNVTPDHLDRHGGMAGYVAAKRGIFNRQTAPRTAVIGVDDDVCRSIHDDLVAAGDQVIIPISSGHEVAGGVYVSDGWLTDDTDGKGVRAMPMAGLRTLPGTHNWQNAAAAYAVGKAVGVSPPVVTACMRSYPGLPHRQELVAIVDGVRFVNDSKATNFEAARRALACYETVYWIAGGRAKEDGLDGVDAYAPRIVHAFLIGEAAEAFAAALDGLVPVTVAETLEVAVERAHAMAQDAARPDPVVLLAPACASFDQFPDFEHRGRVFRDLVDDLPGTRIDPDDLEPDGLPQ